MVRLKDIAEELGVSVMTVSKALRDEPDVSAATKTRIKLTAQQMGYVPDYSAQGLRTRTSKLLGLAVSSASDPLFCGVVTAIEQLAYEMGYDLLMAQHANIPEREEACIRRFLARRVDGIFFAPAARAACETRIFEEVRNRGIPTVVLGPAPVYCAAFACVCSHEENASHSLTQHLLRLGHRRMAYFAGPSASPACQARLEGFKRALAEVGLELKDQAILNAGCTVGDGEKAARQLLSERHGVTAVQAVDDLVALGCIKHLTTEGLRVPQDLSVAGFGNVRFADTMIVPLTTIRQPKRRLGAAAVAAMQNLMKSKRCDSSPIPAELIVRASTGQAPERGR